MKSPDRWFFTEREASDVCAKESAQQVRNRIGHTDKSADFVLCIYSPRAVITIWAPSLAWWYANCSPAVRIGTRQRHPGTSVGLWGREEAVSSQHVAACGQEENMIGVIAGPTFEEQTHISSAVKTEAAPQSRLCLALNDYTYRSRVVSDIVLLMVNMV